jgi:deoxyribodipyrimidine photo-lyase
MNKTGGDGTEAPVVVLFRNDLRVADNRAFHSAAHSGKPVICLFVIDESASGPRPLGGARRWWLHHSLRALGGEIEARGGRLLLRRGDMASIVADIVSASGADTVVWNRRYVPAAIATDSDMKQSLRAKGVSVESFEGHLLHEPSRLKTGAGGPYKVYSPFWRALASEPEPRDPLPAPKSLRSFDGTLSSDDLADWKLLPTAPDWAAGLRAEWTPGEEGARQRLDDFLSGPLAGYGDGRDIPGIASTSRLSPHLAHGEITPFQIWHALASRKIDAPGHDVEKFRKEIGWREFSYHLLFHNPELASANFNKAFDAFPWRPDKSAIEAWRRGLTGYPIVDAGMRELWSTGWMHNRVRMICASFLIKHLLQDWREGEAWFWDTLVDADPASNAASWQWVAGSGADAAPYFRIFNPILQGEKFDPDGAYVRRFLPELANLPDRHIHKPWEAPARVLSDAGVKLGENYPVAVIEHGRARDRAMRAYDEMKGAQ